MPGTLRLRFALLYAGAFALSGAVVLSVAFLASKQVVHAAGPGGPAVTTYPMRGQALAAVTSLAVLALLSVASGWLLAGRLLRPVQAITATAREISAGNLSRRLSHGRRDDELTRLSQTLNDLFARLETSFQAQRHFVASASHELRTPLTAERTVLQVAIADPDAGAGELRAACEEVLRLGEQQERLIDALLTLATSERGIEQPEPFDLAVFAEKVISARGRAGVRVDACLRAAPAAGQPSLAESLIANLVDNALRYNEPGGWVSVETSAAGRRAVLRVRNSGPVIPPGEVDRLFEPFRRHGRERTRPGDGYGLGLAIVAAIVRAHDAGLSATARPQGGLDITVTFG
jgi:signal transduction histidine kinase